MSPLLTDIDHLTRLEEEPIDISSEISGNQLELEIIQRAGNVASLNKRLQMKVHFCLQ